MTVDWNVYDNSSNKLDFSSDISITEYVHKDLKTYNNSYGIFTIDCYFVLYSSQSTTKYSKDICSLRDNSYFKGGESYTFQNKISIVFNSDIDSSQFYVASKAQETTLIANKAPSGGECMVSPQRGTLLIDLFNTSCNRWTDDSGDDELSYNFLYDNFLFLKESYDDTPYVSSLLGNGSHVITGVILDKYGLPSCTNMSVMVVSDENDNLNYALTLTVVDFSTWWTSVYYNLTLNVSVSELSLITDIMNEILEAYIAAQILSASDENSNEEIADLQSQVITSFIDTIVNANVTSTDEAATVLAVLAEITVPLIDTSIKKSSGVSAVYSADVISSILNVVQNPLIALFQTSVRSGELENLDTGTAQNVFGMYQAYVNYSALV